MDGQPDTNTRLQGSRFHWTRLAWLALTLLSVGVFIFSIPIYYRQLLSLSGPEIDQPEAVRANLVNAGISPDFFANYFLTVGLIFASIYVAVAVLIFIRRSDDWLTLLFSLFLVILGLVFTNIPTALEAGGGLGRWLYRLLKFLSYALFIYAFHIFPNGRFDPSWTRCWALLWIVLPLPSFFLEGTPLYLPILHSPMVQLAIFVFPVASILFGTIYRYRRRSNALERQQTKWVVFGISVGLTAFIGGALPNLIDPTSIQLGTPFYFIVQTLFYGFMSLIPLSIGMAIMRSRLWDIDIIIRRTLVYSALTALLVLVYFGTVILLQEVFRALTGDGSSLSVVVSTLAIAALFSPLQRAIQNGIDRRFYRRNYDAAKILGVFETSVRDEVDLNALIEQLLAATNETLQPTQVSLWLRRLADVNVSMVHNVSDDDAETMAE